MDIQGIKRSQNTLQSPSSDNNVDGVMAGALAMGGILFIIPIIISILWVWSLVSIISLNRKFDKFLDLYKEAEFEEISATSGVEGEKHEMSESEIEAAKIADLRKQKRLQAATAAVGIAIVVLIFVIWLIGYLGQN